MDEATQAMVCVAAVPLTILLGVLGWFVWKSRKAQNCCRRCVQCVSDLARTSNERSHAIDGLAEFAERNPEVQALLRASLNDSDPLVRTRAEAVLIPTLLSESGANLQKTLISRGTELPEMLLPFAEFVLENYVRITQEEKYAQFSDGTVRLTLAGKNTPEPIGETSSTSNPVTTIRFEKLNRNCWQAIVNGEPESQYAAIEPSTLVISRDGRRWAYAAQRMKTEWTSESRWVVVSNGVESRAYRWISEISFSPDGKKIGYTIMDGGKYHAVVDGKRYPASETKVHGIAFNHDGSHFAYWTNKAPFVKGEVFFDGYSMTHNHATIASVRFKSPTEVECFYASQRDNTMLEDISDSLNSRIATRFDFGMMVVSHPS